MDQSTYENLLRQRDNVQYSWERKVSKYTIDDIDEQVFREYLKKAKDAGRIEFDETDKKTVLEKLELTHENYLLNAGAALFCNSGINELQMAKFATDERLTFTDIRRFTGSIMELAKKAEQYIIDAMDWRVEIGKGLARREIPEIPLEAIREAIINSFGHKMFDSGQSNEIAIFKNRIEIYNPGEFPAGLTPEIFINGKSRPVRRNPLITRTLYYSKDMESFATGLKRISVVCRNAGCKVEFEQQPYGFAVIFYRKKQQVPEGGTIRETKNNQSPPQVTPPQVIVVSDPISTEEKILTYCSVPRGKKEIAEYAGFRDVKYFSQKYLTPLLQSGQIRMTIPDKPRSRNQKYVATTPTFKD